MAERTYRIEIRGRLPGLLAEDLPQMAIEVQDGITSVTGPVPDGPALYGLIARLEALGADLLAVLAQPDSHPHGASHRAPATQGHGRPDALGPAHPEPAPHEGGTT